MSPMKVCNTVITVVASKFCNIVIIGLKANNKKIIVVLIIGAKSDRVCSSGRLWHSCGLPAG